MSPPIRAISPVEPPIPSLSTPSTLKDPLKELYAAAVGDPESKKGVQGLFKALARLEKKADCQGALAQFLKVYGSSTCSMAPYARMAGQLKDTTSITDPPYMLHGIVYETEWREMSASNQEICRRHASALSFLQEIGVTFNTLQGAGFSQQDIEVLLTRHIALYKLIAYGVKLEDLRTFDSSALKYILEHPDLLLLPQLSVLGWPLGHLQIIDKYFTSSGYLAQFSCSRQWRHYPLQSLTVILENLESAVCIEKEIPRFFEYFFEHFADDQRLQLILQFPKSFAALYTNETFRVTWHKLSMLHLENALKHPATAPLWYQRGVMNVELEELEYAHVLICLYDGLLPGLPNVHHARLVAREAFQLLPKDRSSLLQHVQCRYDQLCYRLGAKSVMSFEELWIQMNPQYRAQQSHAPFFYMTRSVLTHLSNQQRLVQVGFCPTQQQLEPYLLDRAEILVFWSQLGVTSKDLLALDRDSQQLLLRAPCAAMKLWQVFLGTLQDKSRDELCWLLQNAQGIASLSFIKDLSVSKLPLERLKMLVNNIQAAFILARNGVNLSWTPLDRLQILLLFSVEVECYASKDSHLFDLLQTIPVARLSRFLERGAANLGNDLVDIGVDREHG